MAASKDQEMSIDTSLVYCLIFAKNPPDTCLPIHLWPMVISLNLAFNRGINLKIMERVSPSTGAAFPKRYMSLSEVITTLKQLNHTIIDESSTAAASP